MSDDKKVVFKKNQLSGNSVRGNEVVKALNEIDASHQHILNNSSRTKKVLNDLKEVREGGVTKGELRTILADYKYKEKFDKRGVDAIAEHFDIKDIDKYDCTRTDIAPPKHDTRALFKNAKDGSQTSLAVKNSWSQDETKIDPKSLPGSWLHI